MAKFKSLKEAKTFFVLDGWSIELDDEDTVIVSKQKKISHIIHAILTLITGFLWAIVWIVLVLRGSIQRHVITLDEETKVVLVDNKIPSSSPQGFIEGFKSGWRGDKDGNLR